MFTYNLHIRSESITWSKPLITICGDQIRRRLSSVDIVASACSSRAVRLAFIQFSRKTRTRGRERARDTEWLMEDDSFVQQYEPSELEIAAEFLTNWLPFLTRGLCDGCSSALRSRIHSLRPGISFRLPSSPPVPSFGWMFWDFRVRDVI